jgi:hypothetical protein
MLVPLKYAEHPNVGKAMSGDVGALPVCKLKSAIVITTQEERSTL